MTFFQGQMAFTRCILFTRYTREQNTTCKGHLAFQKATISLENDIHSKKNECWDKKNYE